MIRSYTVLDGELMPIEPGKGEAQPLWIDAVAPSPAEVEMLSKQFRLDLQDVADCLDPNERSRVELEESYDLLVLRSVLREVGGHHEGADRVETMPIGIFVTSNCVVTVRIGASFGYEEVTGDLKRKPKLDTKEDMFLMLVRRVNRDIERRVRPMDRTIASIQQRILGSKRSDVAPQAFALSNGLILLNTTLLSNLNALSMLSRAKLLRFSKEQLDLAEDLENDVAQLYEMTTIYREIMANVLNAYESTIANNLSTVMKTLTTISLILILPLLIASLFSMNVGLPIEEEPGAFWIVVGLSAASVAALWLMFRIKGIL